MKCLSQTIQFIALAVLIAFGSLTFMGLIMPPSLSAASPDGEPGVIQTQSEPDIQWFKDQLKISDKYQETREGIFGLSWIHFFVMVFLVAFGICALVLFIIKQVRMNEILARIRKEMENDNAG